MSTTSDARERSPRPTWVELAVRGGGAVVALLFVALGLTKLFLGAQGSLAEPGIPAWVSPLIGAVELAGGVLFGLPRVGPAGAAVLGVLLAGGTAAYFAIRPDGLPLPLVPIALLALVALVTWGRARLAWWNRYRAALDRFTAREVGAGGPGRGR